MLFLKEREHTNKKIESRIKETKNTQSRIAKAISNLKKTEAKFRGLRSC